MGQAAALAAMSRVPSGGGLDTVQGVVAFTCSVCIASVCIAGSACAAPISRGRATPRPMIDEAMKGVIFPPEQSEAPPRATARREDAMREVIFPTRAE